LSIVVACIGTSLSAYVYTWQSNQEVEEEILKGRRHLWQRKGATDVEIERTRRGVLTGMIFSNVILYFIILATGSTLHTSGQTQIETAAQAAAALEPLAGPAAKWLFAAGIIGVGFLAVPIMTTGAAYDIVQGFGKKGSLHAKPSENKFFYVRTGATLLSMRRMWPDRSSGGSCCRLSWKARPKALQQIPDREPQFPVSQSSCLKW
jgi:Mn2+/Fe2+ NRAMP family transporter